VRREAVELDDQVGLGPVEVDFVALDSSARFGPREPVSLDQCEEPVLERALGQLERPFGYLEEPGAAAARVPVDCGNDGGHVQEAQVLRFVDGSLECRSLQDVGEV